MSDFILRNVGESLMQQLRERAERNGRSVSDEVCEILREALAKGDLVRNAEFKRLAAAIRAMSTGRKQTPSEVLLRESRHGNAD